MSDLVRDGETMRGILGDLDNAIAELQRVRIRIVDVRPSAFGSSGEGGQTQRRVARATQAVQTTLQMLSEAHAEVSANLEQVDSQLAEIDEQAAADAARRRAQLDELGAPAVNR